MSSIDKLSIQGIRSFKPETSEVIEFGTPLTLICGQNGCGKTTIIECLKYATTGYLPPNSKGGAFINDPHVSGRKSVAAQIKLAFRSVSGARYIITRTMQLSLTGKGKYTFKTLENVLEKTVKNEKRAVSGKNNDIDTELPNYLGISKPILDYVIFCHQDESLWPLSEPSVLKKKFDDIFQASKFTKVLDNLKTLNKDLAVDIKLLEKLVEHLKIDKRRSNKIVDNLSELKIKIDVLNEEIGDLSLQITEYEDRLERLFNSNQEFQAILSKYDQLTFSKSTLSQQLDRLNSSGELLVDSIEELMDRLQNFDQYIEQCQLGISDINSLSVGYKKQISSIQDKLNELNKLQGSLDFKESEYNKVVMKFDDMAGDVEKDEFLKQLTEALSSLQSKYKSTKASNDTTRSDRTRRLQSITELLSNQKQFKSIKSDNIIELDERIARLQKDVNALNSNEDNLIESKHELEKLTKKYTEASKSGFLSKLDSEITNNETALKVLESKFDQLNKSLQNYNNLNDLMNKINYINQTVKTVQTSQATNIALLEDIVPGLTPDNYQSRFQEVYNKVKNDMDNQRTIHDSKLNKRSSLETTIRINQKDLESLNHQLTITESKITPLISHEEISSYSSILKEAEDDYNESLQTLKTFEVSKDFRIKAVEISKSSNSCLLCQRSFQESELDHFIEYLNKEINGMQKEQVIKQFDESKSDYESLKSIEPEITKLANLKSEISSKTASLKTLQDKLEQVKSEIERDLSTLKEITKSFNKLNDSKYLVEEIKKLQSQIKFNTDKLDGLNKQLKDVGIEDSVDIDELNRLISDNNLDSKNLRIKINNDKELKYAKTKDLSKLNSQIKDLEIEIKNMENGLLDLKNFTKQIGESKENINKLKVEIISIEQKLVELEKERVTEQKDQTQLFHEFDITEKQMTDEISVASNRLEEAQLCTTLMETFEKEDKQRLIDNKKAIERMKEEINQLNSNLNDNTEKVKEYEKQINQNSELRSIIRSSIDFQNTKKELGELEREISDLKIKDAQEAKDKYQEESKSLRDTITQLNSENSYKIGQVKQINEQIKSLQNELNSEYKDIDNVYHEEWIKLQTNLLISSDITTYSKSIDNAIMKYHSIKMEEINKMLKFLWTSTYKGTDIDSIAIKSEVNTQGKSKSYNYRVVMNKKSVELDMRGRCSAGQRVLTSILIRLTLAECFGSNCGIIALDEPTTNLDDENAIGLAESINKIIETRKAQKNFQLVIISHDQNFLSRIHTDDDVYFYRVQRDAHQASVIRRAPIYHD